MIISCLNCNKKFNLDETLIPENGRLLQCSGCNHKWHYSIQKKENVNLSDKKDEIKNNDDKEILIDPSLSLKETTVNKKKANNTSKKLRNKKQDLDIKKKYIKKKLFSGSILNTLLITIITFVAMILILDSFKNKPDSDIIFEYLLIK